MTKLKLKIKSIDELEQLNTPNLLRYYKAERKRWHRYASSVICECCGSFYWEISRKEHKEDQDLYNTWEEYLGTIKTVLNKREHVERK